MPGRNLAVVALGALVVSASAWAGAQHPQSPGWFLARQSLSASVFEQGGGPGGRFEACTADLEQYCSAGTLGGKSCLSQYQDKVSGQCKAAIAAAAEPG